MPQPKVELRRGRPSRSRKPRNGSPRSLRLGPTRPRRILIQRPMLPRTRIRIIIVTIHTPTHTGGTTAGIPSFRVPSGPVTAIAGLTPGTTGTTVTMEPLTTTTTMGITTGMMDIMDMTGMADIAATTPRSHKPTHHMAHPGTGIALPPQATDPLSIAARPIHPLKAPPIIEAVHLLLHNPLRTTEAVRLPLHSPPRTTGAVHSPPPSPLSIIGVVPTLPRVRHSTIGAPPMPLLKAPLSTGAAHSLRHSPHNSIGVFLLGAIVVAPRCVAALVHRWL